MLKLSIVAVLVACSYGAELSYQPPVISSANGRLDLTLDVALLTSINGARTGPAYNGQPIGPTLRVKQGDALSVTLKNSLEPSSALERELYAYVYDPVANEDAFPNVTVIYNRLSAIGNIYNPEFGFWGLNYQNLHWHGLEFPPSTEKLWMYVDGGESATYEYNISDRINGQTLWYHNHVHGTAAYSYLASLMGFIVIDDTPNDLATSPGINGSTEVFLMFSEYFPDANGTVPPFFPVVGAAGVWQCVVNGYVGADTKYTLDQYENIWFRSAGATTEAPIILEITNDASNETVPFVIVAYDGIPLSQPMESTQVITPGGGRVDFMMRFDTPGNYTATRKAWGANIVPNAEACLAAFGFNIYPCISYDIDTLAFSIEVIPSNRTPPSTSLLASIQLPGPPTALKNAESRPSVGTRNVTMDLANQFPLFQIPYDGPFMPPGVALGMDNFLATPLKFQGEVMSKTCETWTVISNPGGFDHTFHTHSAVFFVTAIDAVENPNPIWVDTWAVNDNITIFLCFDAVSPGETFLVHCHMPNHFDIGMATQYMTIAQTTMAPNPSPMAPSAPNPSPTAPSGGPTSAARTASAILHGLALVVVPALVWV